MLLAPPAASAAPGASAPPGAPPPAAWAAHPASTTPAADARTSAGASSAKALFARHCAVCHGAERLGGIGPALLPGNLRRLRRAAAAKVIAEGRPATQMPGFSGVLGPHAVEALVDFIHTPPEAVPRFGMAEIERSRVVHRRLDTLDGEPVFAADPLSLFIVVEQGDHHATVLDGDRFEPLHRFPTRYALHGGPKFSPDGRFVYLASRDGWITQYDLYNLTPVAEIRAGINTRNLAVSCEGRYVMVANYLPHTLVLLDARELVPLAVIPVENDRGETSRVSAVYAAPPRGSFVAALKDLPEVWEIPCRDLAPASVTSIGPGTGGAASDALAGRIPESTALHEGRVHTGNAGRSITGIRGFRPGRTRDPQAPARRHPRRFLLRPVLRAPDRRLPRGLRPGRGARLGAQDRGDRPAGAPPPGLRHHLGRSAGAPCWRRRT